MDGSQQVGRDRAEAGWALECSYARLPGAFFSRVQPTPVSAPFLVIFNRALAAELGLDAGILGVPTAAPVWTGNDLPVGAEPLAQAYSGHQFGHFTRLGDGRAILLGEQRTPDGRAVDVQLKGPGRTPYSRRGDGRAALGPMLREYLVSEAMHALGIPTTRSLAVALTGEPVFRERPLPGAVLTRVAASHIRVGTFEHFAAVGDADALGRLVDYTVDRHFPGCCEADLRPLALLRAVMERQASLVSEWMRVGFVHGVMNTDNMAVSGETLDYGPCAFMDAYDPATVFSSIDQGGRYAFGRQPHIAGWNLARFAEALLPVLDPDAGKAVELAQAVIGSYPDLFHARWMDMMRRKLGLAGAEEGDQDLAEDFLDLLQAARADYTAAFRRLDPERADAIPDGVGAEVFRGWHARWSARIARGGAPAGDVRERMRRANPAVIPRNVEVERVLAAATEGRDIGPFETLLAALQRPYEAAGQPESLLNPPAVCDPGYCTFCGT